MLIPVILAGGTGNRLWPLSLPSQPKQFLPLIDGASLFQLTVLRLSQITNTTAPVILCHENNYFIAVRQLDEIGIKDATFILEPKKKDTAPAIAMAACYLAKKFDDPCLLIAPADHLIKDNVRFNQMINKARAMATNKIITFGVKPTRAETGFGYIKVDQDEVVCFTEKPSLEKAKEYIASDNYYWNSGIFLSHANCLKREIEKHVIDTYRLCEKIVSDIQSAYHPLHLNQALYSLCEAQSFDYAVMEKSEHIGLLPLETDWCDVGSWTALNNLYAKNSEGNVLQGEVLADQTTDCFIHAKDRHVVTSGIHHLIVVATADAVLVADKSHSESIKHVIQQLDNSSAQRHKQVHRPWGYYEIIEQSQCYQVKRLTILPRSSISLQLHYHRSEHWIIVHGQARVTCGDVTSVLSANESTFIPKGMRHQLANTQDERLEVIEIQLGEYLGEDDIVRFEEASTSLPSDTSALRSGQQASLGNYTLS